MQIQKSHYIQICTVGCFTDIAFSELLFNQPVSHFPTAVCHLAFNCFLILHDILKQTSMGGRIPGEPPPLETLEVQGMCCDVFGSSNPGCWLTANTEACGDVHVHVFCGGTVCGGLWRYSCIAQQLLSMFAYSFLPYFGCWTATFGNTQCEKIGVQM